MTLTDTVTQRIITKLIKGQDYRIEIVTLIDAEFLQYVIDFFKRIVDAKLKNHNVTIDWYKKELLDSTLSSDDIIGNDCAGSILLFAGNGSIKEIDQSTEPLNCIVCALNRRKRRGLRR